MQLKEQYTFAGFGLLGCLMPLSTIYQLTYITANSFIEEGTRKKKYQNVADKIFHTKLYCVLWLRQRYSIPLPQSRNQAYNIRCDRY